MLLVAAALAFDVPDPTCTGSKVTFTSTLAEATTWAWAVDGVKVGTSDHVDWKFNDPGVVAVTLDMDTPSGAVHEDADVEVLVGPDVTLAGAIVVDAHEQTDYDTTGPDGLTFSWAVTGGTLLGDVTGPSALVEWGEQSQGTIEVTATAGNDCAAVEHLDVAINLPEVGDGGDTGDEPTDPGCGCATGGAPAGAGGALAALSALALLRRRCG